MANGYIKHYTCNTRKEVLQKIYDYLVAGDDNWEVVYEYGGYDTSTPADADFFVIGAKTAWGDGSGLKQQLLLCANDNTTTTKTFGGSANNKWTIADDSFSFIYSPDGGWDDTNKDFSAVTTSLTEIQKDFDAVNTATPGYDLCVMTTVDEFMFTAIETTSPIGLFAGAITSLDDSANDPRPCALFWGNLTLSSATNNNWGATLAGNVPNAARDGWYTATSESSAAKLDSYGTTKIDGTYVEMPLPIYSVSSPKFAGVFKSLRRVSTARANGDVSSAGDRIAFGGITFPWEV